MNIVTRSVVVSAAPLISLVNALPHSYVPLNINTIPEASNGDQSSEEAKVITLEKKKEDGPKDDGQGIAKVTDDTADTLQLEGQCVRDGDFTYYSNQQLIGGGAEEKPILIEECDPFNPDQIRLAYVANKSYAGRLSPTSILIGCTTLQSDSFTSRYGGAFKKVSGGSYTNFVGKCGALLLCRGSIHGRSRRCSSH
jgi:hypothetical protein